MGWLNAKRAPKQPELVISPEMLPKDLRQAIIDYGQLHSDWYKSQARKMSNKWNYITFAIITLSAVSSVLAAYDLGSEHRWLPAGLTATAGLGAAYLTQFRVRDLWQIRENGRITAEKLVAKAQALEPTGKPLTYTEIIALRMELHDLEMDQMHQFFAVPKSK